MKEVKIVEFKSVFTTTDKRELSYPKGIQAALSVWLDGDWQILGVGGATAEQGFAVIMREREV